MNEQIKDVGQGEWQSGSPPSVGWWPAAVMGCLTCLRWWDGKHWSVPAFPKEPMETVNRVAMKRSCWQKEVKWRHRADWWPERSRT